MKNLLKNKYSLPEGKRKMNAYIDSPFGLYQPSSPRVIFLDECILLIPCKKKCPVFDRKSSLCITRRNPDVKTSRILQYSGRFDIRFMFEKCSENVWKMS